MIKDDDMYIWLYAKTPGRKAQYDNLQVAEVGQCAIPVPLHATPVFAFNFEENLDGWQTCDDNNCAMATRVERGYNSTHAIRVSNTDVNHPGVYHYIDNYYAYVENVKAGEFYRISVWCNADLNDTCYFVFTNRPNNNDRGGDNRVEEGMRGNNGWQLLSLCKKMSKDARMSVHLYAVSEKNNAVLYDDLQVEKVDGCP